MDRETIPTRYEALCAALEIARTQTALADMVGLSQAAVWKWFQTTKQVPIEHVPAIARETGIPDYYFRPDFFKVPPRAKVEPLADIVARNRRPKQARRRSMRSPQATSAAIT